MSLEGYRLLDARFTCFNFVKILKLHPIMAWGKVMPQRCSFPNMDMEIILMASNMLLESHRTAYDHFTSRYNCYLSRTNKPIHTCTVI